MLTCCICNEEKPESEFYKDCTKSRGYSYRCKLCNKAREKAYRNTHQAQIKEYNKTYKYKKKSQKDKEYYRRNSDKIKNHVREYVRNRRKTDPYFKAKESLRSRIGAAFRAVKIGKPFRSNELLGCSSEVFKLHIESLFRPGMCWENHGYGSGKWVFDHIIPLSAFNLEDNSQALQANHYTNIQPLWFDENASKSDKIITASCPDIPT